MKSSNPTDKFGSARIDRGKASNREKKFTGSSGLASKASGFSTLAIGGLYCPELFGFADLIPTLFKVDGSTYIRFNWETGYNMVQKKIIYREVLGSWQTLGPTVTTGASFSMDSILAIGKGNYEWYAWNLNACDDWGQSTLQTFDIVDGTPPDDYQIVIT